MVFAWITLAILTYFLIGFTSMGIYIVATKDQSNWEASKKFFYAWPREIIKRLK